MDVCEMNELVIICNQILTDCREAPLVVRIYTTSIVGRPVIIIDLEGPENVSLENMIKSKSAPHHQDDIIFCYTIEGERESKNIEK